MWNNFRDFKSDRFSKKNDLVTILSARSGDTEENFLSSLAVSWNVDMIKVG